MHDIDVRRMPAAILVFAARKNLPRLRFCNLTAVGGAASIGREISLMGGFAMCLIPSVEREATLSEVFSYDAEGRSVVRPDRPVLEAPETERCRPEVIERYHWTGRECETDLALQFNRTRCYDPVVGRYLRDDAPDSSR
jgi:hypothetical protein